MKGPMALRQARARRHRGDIMSPAKRSALMSRIRGRDTGIERTLAAVFAEAGLDWESHCADLPGRPDFVFRRAGLAVFVDGDFWHGWRFPVWRDKLSEKWEAKIAANRARDVRNHRRLRRAGWRVIRLWEHQVERDLEGCLRLVISRLARVAGRAKQPSQGAISRKGSKRGRSLVRKRPHGDKDA